MWLTHDRTYFFLVYLIMLCQLQMSCSREQQTDYELRMLVTCQSWHPWEGS